jgi:hypothetical protein
MKTLAFLTTIGLAAAPVFAADGVLIVEKATTGTTTHTNQMQIEKTRMRGANAGPNGEEMTMIFDGTKQVLWMINDTKKTYNEMTKADVDRLAGQMSDAMAQMQAQMANIPPAQRAQMEAMMRGRGMPGAAAPVKTEYRKVGTDKVGKWTCDRYDGYQNNEKTSELCTVDPKELGFALTDFEVARQLAEFFSKLVPQGADAMFRVGNAEAQGFSGVPVRRTTLGARASTSEITEVSRQNFPDSTFQVPAGFQKEPFGMPGGRGRGR